jgi:hypothetical protein
MRKCTDEQVLKIRDLIWNQGKGYNEAAREAGVDRLGLDLDYRYCSWDCLQETGRADRNPQAEEDR